ncbi:hypothetical protein K439DRAFT_1661343 [Ramaria rubella]|nr:hypothetical protein K439DRAFT_1661343 [Ramaria rubella]
MGNAQSSSSSLSTRGTTLHVQSGSQETQTVLNPRTHDVVDTPQPVRTPMDNEGDGAPPHVVQRRRSLMKFPLLRRRQRSSIGSSNADSEVLDSTSSSRRRWRAFSGLKPKPVSTIPIANSPSIVSQLRQDSPRPSTMESTHNEKGKEREREIVEIIQDDERDRTLDGQEDIGEPGPSAIENKQPESAPDAMLQELRDLQDTLFVEDEFHSGATVDLESHPDIHLNQSDRPPTPIPTSAGNPGSGSRENDMWHSNSSPALSDTLGSWMSGRSRTENIASAADNTSLRPSPQSYGADPSMGSTDATRGVYDSEMLSSFARNSSQAASALGSPSTTGLLSTPTTSQTSPSTEDRRTLPPAGTGTLVVVQGVVHTTDVRPSYGRTPSVPRPESAPHIASSRPASSTPTPRDTSPPNDSRASTPQPPLTPRRNRFSSLTNGLRQRSRPQTPSSLRNTGTSAMRHGIADYVSGSGTPSETASERSLRLGLATERSLSEPETSRPANSSSTGTFESTAEDSVLESSPCAQCGDHVAVDSGTPQSDSEVHNEGHREGTSPTVGAPVSDRLPASNGERDGFSDDESEAELSASSIEVLGTLLSVATAATAASLVTGTTDPLFSSGLAGPLANGRNASSALPRGSVSPFSRGNNPLPSSSDDINSEAAANTRMRAAWESLRDRFSRTRGRRGTTPASGGDGEDPREQMLREMARAFNMGLGLDNDGHDEPNVEQPNPRSGEVTSGEGSLPPAAQPLPELSNQASAHVEDRTRDPVPESGPEGSFERFLHNLQVDLRTALTEDYAARRARAHARTTVNPGSASLPDAAATPNSATDMAALSNPNSVTGLQSDHDQETSVPPVNVESGAEVPSIIPPLPNTPRTANLDLPPLPPNIDARYRDESTTPPQAQGITGQPGAGINWWRLYRFPPMQLVPHSSIPTADPSSASTTAHSSSSENMTGTSPETQSTLSASTVPTPNAGALPQGAQTQHVVPVIVVGLQSVPVDRAEAHDPPPFGARPPNDNPLGSNIPSDVPGRGRPWPLRAASRAFGRRSRQSDTDLATDESSTASENATGNLTGGRQSGRTYLIFVIGGYYPPNHSIVTGADDMNSFEALWELADLLGQVKPPVASKEDIENSGLEILKASTLPDYEKSGKVAYNTVERCLICLDDYEPDDDLRLLSCRHAFHKQCVDKWLEQGRNNCPACRSKGVPTEHDEPPPTAQVVTETPR